ncbi:MAG: histidinol dehydrogenase [Betaproteobacteria bacterium]|nr:histidinol dehydrogenase [Betaproteobacteria bacterium]
MLDIRRLDSVAATFGSELDALIGFDVAQDAAVDEAAARILADVRSRGDAAVLEYTARFDRVIAADIATLTLSPDDFAAALRRIGPVERAALLAAASRIRAYHEHQRLESWHYTEADGTVLGQRITPIDRVGLYIPGGKAAYPSSLLMNAIPAKVAGVQSIVMVVPTPEGVRNDLVLAAAAVASVECAYTIGGAQAIGALAYGTASIPKVDKIVGPGNAYVAAAKRRVFGTVGIDMIAGPSEILIICDGNTDPDWIAMDLFSQAEHDEVAQAILLSPDAAFLDAVEASIGRLIQAMPRKDIIGASMTGRGALIHTQDLEDACSIANRIAPEHLELSVCDPGRWIERIRHAGAIFLGRHSSEALGDYCAGPNHVLPTSGTARFSSPLGVYDFQKRSSVINVSVAGAQTLGRIAVTLAQGEGLPAHARSAAMRIGP